MKSYGQHCGLAKALDLIGERWTLLMIREFLLGPRRYGQLLEELDGMTTNLLAQRLKAMQESGLIERVHTVHGSAYQLTEFGQQLERPLMELARWGSQLLDHNPHEATRKLSWALLSSKRRYEGGETLRVEIRCHPRTFSLVFADQLTVREQPDIQPDLRLSGSQEAFFHLLFGAPSTEKVVAQGQGLETLARAWKIANVRERVSSQENDRPATETGA